MIPVARIAETQGYARVHEPITLGLPFPQGNILSADTLALATDSGEILKADFTVTARWPDSSVRWCLVNTQVSIQAHAETHLSLMTNCPPAQEAPPLNCLESGEMFVVGSTHFSARLHSQDASLTVVRDDNAFELNGPQLTDMQDNRLKAVVDSTECVRSSANSALILSQHGHFSSPSPQLPLPIRFTSRWQFYGSSPLARLDITLENPNRAQHENGHWDIDDPAAFAFRRLHTTVKASGQNATVGCQLDTNTPLTEQHEGFSIVQHSSGGQHWNSKNHVNADGDVTLNIKGFRCTGHNAISEGERAQPIIFTRGLSLTLDKFWQNFPSGFSVSPHKISTELFPRQSDQHYRLQGGEHKTHTVFFDFSDDPQALTWTRHPVEHAIDPELVARSGSIPTFTNNPTIFDKLINNGLHPTKGFVAKREIIDEFGWRNFGDIFADHESLYRKADETPFISHYNNQYDPLYGFVRQYLTSGNNTWRTLANDLARHVADIDIYHTQNDRAEYNGGLFWHTDHYVDAFTAGHRTYSRNQKPDGVNPTEGGGPGGQHCYTQGLQLHYFLTGQTQSRDSVVSLANWLTHYYEGSGGLTETLLQLKNTIVPLLKSPAPKGGFLYHRLPFDRGVGNYINALLDRFLLDEHTTALTQVETIIRDTFHPHDDIAQRNLSDIEGTWFYTVFLQAVIRYLIIAKQFGANENDAYDYTFAALLHYAHWMLENETPYLSKPEKLDFPNETWTAQDIRKAHIFYFVSGCIEDTAVSTQYREKADEFSHYVVERLQASQEQSFSRILALLMQNYGAEDLQQADVYVNPNFISSTTGKSKMALLGIILKQLTRAVLRFSLKKELHWLSFRNARAAKLYNSLYEH
ncbi:RIFT barrel domain-containing protein [Teredinibacter purpureus]|uniref:RIFT barrel domain-containing protein n=1 Tax=Teredinibacter purpureus TaxID=2731756 RepID=UPI0006982063|nr:hypothetical protein [Teredinibacter purpureus]